MSDGRRSFAHLRVGALLTLTAIASSCGGGGEPTAPPPAVASIALTPRDTTLVAGATVTFTARVLDQEGSPMSGQVLTWSSSDPTVATVTGGVVTALQPGVTTLIAKSGTVEGRTTVTVIAAVSEVRISPSPDTVIIGQGRQLTVVALDATGATLSGRRVTWSTSDATRATVSGAGLVTGIAAGTVTITAASEGRTGTATVVVRPVPVATVTVTPSLDTLIAGQTRQLTAALTDASGAPLTGREVVWSSTDGSRATVSQTGLVTAVSPGPVTILAASDGKTGTATIVVVPVPVATVTLDPSPLSVGTGSTATLTVALRDAAGQPLTGRPVAWTTANSAVATVSQAGVVTGVTAGTTTVTATSEGKADTVTVTVNDATVPFVSALTIAPTTVHVSSLARDVAIAAGVGDRGGSGVASVTFTGTAAPGGTVSTCTATAPSAGDATNGTWGCTLTVPANTPSGVWAVTVAAVDAAGNRVELGRSALEQAQLPGSFTVNYDPDPPAVRTATFEPPTVNVGSSTRQVTVSSVVEDPGSGVLRYDVIATAPDGVTKVSCSSTAGPASGTPASGTWSCVLDFPASSQVGNWGVTVRATDAALNVFIVLAGTISVVNQ